MLSLIADERMNGRCWSRRRTMRSRCRDGRGILRPIGSGRSCDWCRRARESSSPVSGRAPDLDQASWRRLHGRQSIRASIARRYPAIELWRSVEQDRKKAWRVISVLGPAVLMCAALRLIRLDEVLFQLGGRLALSVKAVRLSNPVAGVDVDKAGGPCARRRRSSRAARERSRDLRHGPDRDEAADLHAFSVCTVRFGGRRGGCCSCRSCRFRWSPTCGTDRPGTA